MYHPTEMSEVQLDPSHIMDVGMGFWPSKTLLSAVGLGYLLTWTAAGLVFYGLLAAVRAPDFGALTWDQAGRYVAGGVIAAAGLYQFTPFKLTCLTKCRDPFLFLLSSWKRPYGRAANGHQARAWCVGCCWALMAALFALRVMSFGWMAFIAALIAIEKLLPWKTIANRGDAVSPRSSRTVRSDSAP